MLSIHFLFRLGYSPPPALLKKIVLGVCANVALLQLNCNTKELLLRRKPGILFNDLWGINHLMPSLEMLQLLIKLV